jgi:hypothetical protein
MADGDDPSPLAAVAGGDAQRAVAAFTALSDETRLAILLALWEAYSPAEPDAGTSFSTLRDRVGTPDSGRFNYHLGKLTGRFVREVADGYALTRTGRSLVRTIVAGAGIDEPAMDPTPIDVDCPLCGAQLAVTYESGWLYEVCTTCAGAFGGNDDQPDGYLAGMALDPSGLADRSPDEAWAAARTRAFHDLAAAVDGVCEECSGRMERSLDVCPDHQPGRDGEGGDAGDREGPGEQGRTRCPTCDRRPPAMVYFGCAVCKHHHATSPAGFVVHHPAVVAFYHDRGVELGHGRLDVEAVERRTRLSERHDVTVTGTDPPAVRVTVRAAGDELSLTLDESAVVTDYEVA